MKLINLLEALFPDVSNHVTQLFCMFSSKRHFESVGGTFHLVEGKFVKYLRILQCSSLC